MFVAETNEDIEIPRKFSQQRLSQVAEEDSTAKVIEDKHRVPSVSGRRPIIAMESAKSKVPQVRQSHSFT